MRDLIVILVLYVVVLFAFGWCGGLTGCSGRSIEDAVRRSTRTNGPAQPGRLTPLGVPRRADADAVEIRILLGRLVEKQRTTPEQYPLSLNSLRLACNQATNRDPVVDYDEAEIRAALDRLSRRGWVRLASGPGSRVAKYRHLLDDALGRVPSQIALLAVLMLRGPQTPGELKQRVERLYPYPSLEDIEQALEALSAAELVEKLPAGRARARTAGRSFSAAAASRTSRSWHRARRPHRLRRSSRSASRSWSSKSPLSSRRSRNAERG